MNFSSTEKPHYLSLLIEEEQLTAQTAPDLKSELVRLNALGHKNLVVDLQKV